MQGLFYNKVEMNSSESKSRQTLFQAEIVKNAIHVSRIGEWILTTGLKDRPYATTSSAESKEILGVGKDSKMTDEQIYEWWKSRLHPDDRQFAMENIEKMNIGENNDFTYRWFHPTLGLRVMRSGGFGVKDGDGKVVISGYLYDITDLLEKSRQDTIVAMALAKTYSCLFYLDLVDMSYTSYTLDDSAVAKLLPSSGPINEANTKLIAERICDEKDYEALRQFTDPDTLNERMKDTSSLSAIFKGAHVKWVRISFHVIDRRTDGSIIHVMETIRDVSGERERELAMIRELKHRLSSGKSMSMMFQNMIHEIRTPLNAMFGFSQLLCVPGVDVSDEQKKYYSDIIHNCFEMLSNLIDDVLDFVDAEHGNFRIRKKTFNVNQMGRSLVQISKMRAQAGVKVYFTSEVGDDFSIDSDERRIEQVLLNFLTNSCKHTFEGEICLHVSTSENPGRLTFSVTDTGTGISTEMAETIFERYKKGNPEVDGSGIGLHICGIIADRLGAELKLDRDYKDGARFMLII